MRSKVPLLLMEQMVMLLVFALAAALCLRSFVTADELSYKSKVRDEAVLAAQSVAEVIRSQGGSVEQALAGAAVFLGGKYNQGVFQLEYDESWNPGGDRYFVTAQAVHTEIAGCCEAVVEVKEKDGQVLFCLQVAWQEVMAHG